ncbi:hypothetical protein ES707_14232 [subsurface metagenome]
MYYQSFTVVGVVNVPTLDAGLISLMGAPVRIRAVIINCDTTEGNLIEGWIGTDRILQIYDYNLDTQEETAAATAPLSTNKMGRIPIEENIPPGQIFKIGVLCGAVANTLFGAYEYGPAE